jgi:hypothetical protein
MSGLNPEADVRSRAKKIVSIPSILVGIPTNFPDGPYASASLVALQNAESA